MPWPLQHNVLLLVLLQVVVVLSGSMEPGFQRGDILFLNMGTAPVRTGVCVCVCVWHCGKRDPRLMCRLVYGVVHTDTVWRCKALTSGVTLSAFQHMNNTHVSVGPGWPLSHELSTPPRSLLTAHVTSHIAGEVVVFNINGRDIPIVHRVIKVHERADENHLDILTKVIVVVGRVSPPKYHCAGLSHDIMWC